MRWWRAPFCTLGAGGQVKLQACQSWPGGPVGPLWLLQSTGGTPVRRVRLSCVVMQSSPPVQQRPQPSAWEEQVPNIRKNAARLTESAKFTTLLRATAD